LDNIFDVGALISGDFLIQTVVTPTFPIVIEDLAKAIMPGGEIGMLEGVMINISRNFRIHACYICTACTTLIKYLKEYLNSGFVHEGH
jgi:hypothetical protein